MYPKGERLEKCTDDEGKKGNAKNTQRLSICQDPGPRTQPGFVPTLKVSSITSERIAHSLSRIVRS